VKSRFALRAASCAAVAVIAACSTSQTDDVATRGKADAPACTVMGGPGAIVTTSAGATCAGCAAVQAELAGDGDIGTSATVVMPANVNGGFTLRVSQPGAIYAAGRRAGMQAVINRVVALPYRVVLRTYLDDVQQQESAPLERAAGQPYVIDTDKPFNGVEIVVDAVAATTGGEVVEVYEACSDVALPADEPVEDPPAISQPTVAAVVADLSTGANPYHVVYRRPAWKKHPSKVIPGFPSDAPALHLTFGPDLQASLAADAQKWQDMRPGVTYWIPGTNLLYVRTRNEDLPEPEGLPDGVSVFGEPQHPYQTHEHGTWTPGVIADACQDCYVLVVSDPEGGFTYSLDFIGRHTPWVDVAASTQNAAANDPRETPKFPLSVASGPLSEYASAAKRWAESGRLYFIAAGNEPVPQPFNDRHLPPWFTIVSGAYAECRGVEAKSAKPNEFVSEYVVQAPAWDSVEAYETVSGTSFSTPLVAARFAQALQIIRRELKDQREPGTYWSGKAQNSSLLADGKLTREDMYQAFAQAAELFATSEYTGPCGYQGVPASPTPWLEMGWGYVGPDQATLAADLILGRATPPAKPAEQAQYMDAYLSAREASGTATP
jgi:hypothetical protein